MNSLTELCGLPTNVSEIIGNASLSILDCVVAIPYENTTHRSTDTVASRTNVDARISAYSRARARLIMHAFITRIDDPVTITVGVTSIIDSIEVAIAGLTA